MGQSSASVRLHFQLRSFHNRSLFEAPRRSVKGWKNWTSQIFQRFVWLARYQIFLAEDNIWQKIWISRSGCRQRIDQHQVEPWPAAWTRKRGKLTFNRNKHLWGVFSILGAKCDADGDEWRHWWFRDPFNKDPEWQLRKWWCSITVAFSLSVGRSTGLVLHEAETPVPVHLR